MPEFISKSTPPRSLASSTLAGKERFRKTSRLIGVTQALLGKRPFIRYFDSVTNVGDQLNLDIVRHYSGKEPVQLPHLLRKTPHYLIVGSIAEKATSGSTLLGAGLNKPELAKHLETFGRVKIVRGRYTRDIIGSKRSNKDEEIILGDPGLLIGRIIEGLEPRTDYEVGLVLHYADANHRIAKSIKEIGGTIIPVNQAPRDFAKQIIGCRRVLSSSLHGVIFSDALKIPNIRLKLSDRITGADFKFKDYYSTTDRPDKDFIDIRECLEPFGLDDAVRKCALATYRYDLDDLETCLVESLCND